MTLSSLFCPCFHHRAGIRRLWWGAGLMMSAIVVLGQTSLVSAQPQTNEERVAPEQQQAAYRWRELQKQMSAVELKQPEQAIAAYQGFYETSGHLYADVAVSVTSRIAQLHGRALKNPTKAVELYEWALEQWGDTPYKERLQREAAQMKALAAGAKASATKPGGVAAVAPVPVTPVTAVGVPLLGSAPSAVGVPSLGRLPMTAGVPAVVSEPSTVGVAFSVGGSQLAATVEAIQAGSLSAEAAWTRGELSAEQALSVLNELYPRGRIEGPISIETRRALADVVVKHAPQQLEQPGELSLLQRVWLGEVLGAAKDERAAVLLQSVVDELNGQMPLTESREKLAAFMVSERLGWFYRDTEQPAKSAAAWMQVPALLKGANLGNQSWFLPDAMLEAARAYAKVGETEKSDALYKQVSQSGHGWTTILSLYDKAQPLLNAGKLAEARAMLSQPLELTSNQTEGLVAQNAWLASIAYRQGDLESALRYGEQMKAEAVKGKAESARGEIARRSVKGLYDMGLDIYNRAGGWKNQPIQTDTKKVVFQANPSQPEAPLYARFRIVTYGDKSVTASVDNPNIQARVLPVNNWQRGDLNAHEEEMEVIVQSNSLNKFNDVPLVLSSATRGKTTTVRLSLVERSA